MALQQIVWDPVKARRNKKKHGVDFEEAATVFRDPLLLILPDPEHSGEEERWVALGKSVSQLLLVVVHTEDERTVRIVSARKAEPRERRQYEREF
ncbi:MAG: BrnT family toxin [Terracidiphilus sp.]